MKHRFFIVLMVSFFSCKSDDGEKEKSLGDTIPYVDTLLLKKTLVSDPDIFIMHPTGYKDISTFLDSTINGIAFNDCDTIRKLFGDTYELLPDIDDLPGIQIFNKDQSQLLTMYMFNGSSKCDFSQFQVEYAYSKARYLQKPFNLKIHFFKSGKGIYLGMTSAQLISMFGKANEIKQEKGFEILSYQQYNGLYFGDYYFKNKKLVKYRFGDEYP